MINTKLTYIIIFLVSVFISSVSQIMLKKSTEKIYKSKLNEYLNFKVIFAYGLFFLSSLLTVLAYKNVPLSMGPILEATGYIYVSVLGFFLLKEKIGIKKGVGMGIIVIGIIIFNIS